MEKKFYDHKEVEKKWRTKWEAEKLYEIKPDDARDKYYCLDMFPYPSGSGLHVGHWRGYTLSDYYARYQRLQGKNVLHPMGLDSFGLPAERAAIKDKTHPKKYTDEAAENFIKELKTMGSSFDWSKYLSTSDPNYYHWTQWLFIQLFNHGMAEKRLSQVNWCPNDQTVLANEQVVNGCCERCGTTVTKKELSQWYLKTTAFAQDLLDGLDEVKWPDRVKSLQRDWIGKSSGTLVKFASEQDEIEVFTTRVDTIFGVNALVLAPEHPLVEKLATDEQKSAVEEYVAQTKAKTNIDREQNKEKTAVFTGSYATHPLTGDKIPVWVADYVLLEYGTGAVMSVPAHDERDYDFAKKYDLPILPVVLKASDVSRSYLMGAQNITNDDLEKIGVKIFEKTDSESRKLEIPKSSLRQYEELITSKLTPGFWNEYVGSKIVLIFKDKDGKVKRFVLDENNANEINQLAVEFIGNISEFNLLQDMISDGADGFYKEYLLSSEKGALINSGEFTGLTSHEAIEKITARLQEKGLGQSQTTYRLRDWLVSRQRYWGAPIPIVYDPEGQPHAVKEEHLPLLLPEDVDFLPGGESPIARSVEYKERAEKLYGKGWHFDTDTLDTFVDSSWYYLRYLTPNADNEPFSKELVKKWLPVDLYIGGIEHATLHLMYARFITRFLAKSGYIDEKITEPFTQLFNIGHITMHGAKMSKSKGNVVVPEEIIEHYGTDALRGYELFIGPMDVEAEWSTYGINGIHRFLLKVFQYYSNYSEPKSGTEKASAEFATYLANVNQMIATFRLNTAISEAMKFINIAEKSGMDKKTAEGFLITLSPIFPFMMEELWEQLGHNESIFKASWPVATIHEKTPEIKILVNQKFIKMLPTNETDEEKVVELAMSLPEVSAKLTGGNFKPIYKAGAMINFVKLP